MKRILFFISFIVLISQTGCKQTTEPTGSEMYVTFEIESAFQNDSVKFMIDDTVLLQSRITTNYTIDLAWSSGLQKLSRENHTVHFSVIEYGTQKDYTIDITNDTSSILLRFDKSTKQINIEQIQGRLLRD